MSILTLECNAIINSYNSNPEDLDLLTLFSCLDLTDLSPVSTEMDIQQLCQKVLDLKMKFPSLSVNVAAVCIFPTYVSLAKRILDGSPIKIATVTGAFPHSQMLLDLKLEEARRAVEMGADELDIVLNLSTFLGRQKTRASQEILAIKEAIGHKKLKVILEVSMLKNYELVAEAADLAIESGADFIKTSTGKDGSMASLESIFVMCQCIKRHYRASGNRIGIKPAGGIRTIKDALGYYAIVKSVLGEEWLNPQYFRIGASSLANSLLHTIYGQEECGDYF